MYNISFACLLSVRLALAHELDCLSDELQRSTTFTKNG